MARSTRCSKDLELGHMDSKTHTYIYVYQYDVHFMEDFIALLLGALELAEGYTTLRT